MARVVKSPVPATAKPAPASNKPAAPRTPPRKQPAAVSGRPGRFGALSRLSNRSLQQTSTATFFREAFSELRKVHWPSREETVHMTVIVIVFSLATGIFLGGLDFIFAQFITFLVGA